MRCFRWVCPLQDAETCCLSCEIAPVDSVTRTELKQIWLITLAATCTLLQREPRARTRLPKSPHPKPIEHSWAATEAWTNRAASPSPSPTPQDPEDPR